VTRRWLLPGLGILSVISVATLRPSEPVRSVRTGTGVSSEDLVLLPVPRTRGIESRNEVSTPPIRSAQEDFGLPQDERIRLEAWIGDLELRAREEAQSVLAEWTRDVKKPLPQRLWGLRRLGQFHRDADKAWLHYLVEHETERALVIEARSILRSAGGDP